MLEPAGGQGVRDTLADLMLVTNMPSNEGLSFVQLKAVVQKMGDDYVRFLDHLPLDILKAAADECVRLSRFYPKPADILQHADEIHFERKQMRRRAIKLLDLYDVAGNLKSTRQETPPETYEQKMAGMIASYLKVGKIPNAAKLEYEFARKQNRQPAAWARECFEGARHEAQPQQEPAAPRAP